MHHDRLGRLIDRLLRRRRRRAAVHTDLIDASWHVDTDAICPDCLRWIRADDYVRRNAFDLLEHEICPPASARTRL
ncbi:MAG: hypothetical protein QOI54_3417 [Actinomycetota bacterium]|jgi:hypothetical protein|nr:hypothetical protein [Actinomycetota bacterium]